MGLFQSVFSVSEDGDADLDPFQRQEGTYKKLDIDQVAVHAHSQTTTITASPGVRAQGTTPPKKNAHKLYSTAPRQRPYRQIPNDSVGTGKRKKGWKLRHSEKIGRNRPKPIVLGPDASINAQGLLAVADHHPFYGFYDAFLPSSIQ